MSFTDSIDEIVSLNKNGLLGSHSSWSRVPLSQVCDVQNGFPFESRCFNTIGRGAPLLRIRDVTRGTTETYYDGPYDEVFLVRQGDIVVGMDGDFNVCRWKGPPALLNQRVCRLIPKGPYLSGLVPLVLQGYLDAINARTSSITVKHLSSRTVEQIPLPLPPSGEQLRLLDALESYLSRLDAAVASLDQAQARLKAYRASVLKAAVEGRLVPTEANLAPLEGRDLEPAQVLLDRILSERRRHWEQAELARLQKAGKPPGDEKWKAKYAEPEPPDTTDLPELPEGWCWASIDELLIEGPQNGLYVPKSRYGSGVPIIRIDDYQPHWSRASAQLQRVMVSDEVRETYALAVGDLVLNRVNSPSHLGKTLLVEPRHLPAVFESNMMRFRLGIGAASRYAQVYLSSPGGKRRLLSNAKWAVNQASINQEDVRSCAVPLPPFEEQQRIVAEVDRLTSTSEAIQRQSNDVLRRCSRLSQAILRRAFEGRLVDQDPTDEPAEALLGRLRTERVAQELTRKLRARRTKVKS